MIIVQLFTADQYAPRQNIATGVIGLKVAVAPEVADAVDNTRGENRDPHHLDGPDGDADKAE